MIYIHKITTELNFKQKNLMMKNNRMFKTETKKQQ